MKSKDITFNPRDSRLRGNSAYIIAGPTASGKSDFAHALARSVNGVIINADSVQIYKGIENISASPLAASQQLSERRAQSVDVNSSKLQDNLKLSSDNYVDGIPYKLFSILPLTEQISVMDYLEMARREYDAAIAGGRVPIFVGGSGYYIGVLLNGISPIPNVSDANRARARSMVRDYPNSVRELLGDDFTADPQRTARAMEVFLETGRPLSEWQKLPRVGAITPMPFKIFINPNREILCNRIAARIPKMLNGGAMVEAREVIKANWDESRAIGAGELCDLIRGQISEKECNQNWITRTNQYAKRQRTWFRGQFNADLEINHVPTDADIEKVLNV